MIDRDGYCQPLDRSNPVEVWREICARTARRGFVRVSWRSPLSAWLDVLISLRIAAGTLTFPECESRGNVAENNIPGNSSSTRRASPRWKPPVAGSLSLRESSIGNRRRGVVAVESARRRVMGGCDRSRRRMRRIQRPRVSSQQALTAENLCRPSHRTADSPLRPLCDVRLRRWNLSARAYSFA